MSNLLANLSDEKNFNLIAIVYGMTWYSNYRSLISRPYSTIVNSIPGAYLSYLFASRLFDSIPCRLKPALSGLLIAATVYQLFFGKEEKPGPLISIEFKN